MRPQELMVILERIAELVESKMAVSKALRQVSNEILAFDHYCNENNYHPRNITTDNLKNCKL